MQGATLPGFMPLRAAATINPNGRTQCDASDVQGLPPGTTAIPGGAAMMKSAHMMLFSRVLAAIFGGYALTSGVAVLLSAVLPLSRAEAVLTATLSAFVVYTCAVIWVFAVQDLRRAWLGMLLPAILCGGIGLLLSRGAA